MARKPEFGTGSGWEIVDEIHIRGRLSLSDTSYFYDEPVIIAVEAGTYEIAVCYATFDGQKHLVRLRVGISPRALSRGSMVGTLHVDFGQLGICDRDEAEAAFDALGDDGMPQYYAQLNTTVLVGWVHLPGLLRMLIARPGFGDGTYPVYELINHDGRRKGVEIDCYCRDADLNELS